MFKPTKAQIAAADKYNASLRLDAGSITLLTFAAQEVLGLAGKDLDGKLGPLTHQRLLDRYRGPQWPAALRHPMVTLSDGRRPVVTSGFKHPLRPNHTGVDLFYLYLEGDPPMKIGDGGRTAKWWVPEAPQWGSQVVAVADGRITHASYRPTGYRVWLDIGDYSVGYFHLSTLRVGVGQTVIGGQTLGYIGDNPIDNDPRHLHLEVHEGDVDAYPKGLIDPEIMLRRVNV